MRVLHLLSQTGLTGTELFVRDLVEEQQRNGWQVCVVSDRFHIPLSAPTIELPLATSSRWERLRLFFRLRRLIRSEKYDVIHCHSRAAARNGYWARLGTGSAMVTTLHGRQRASFSRRLHDIYGTYVSVICDNLKTTMSGYRLTAPEKLRIIRNPVQIARWPFKEDRGEPRLLLVGRATGPKGEFFVHLATSFFAQWLTDFPKLKIDLILPLLGRLDMASRHKLEVLSERFADRLNIHGSVIHLAPQYQSAWAVVGAGRVAIEALLSGSHLIAAGEYSTVGLVTRANRRVALASNFGDIGPEGGERQWDFGKIDKAVREIFTKPAFNNPNAREKREWIEGLFSAEDVHRQYEELYKAARFKLHHPKHIPILMYHKVPDGDLESKHKIFVPRARFEKHLRWLKSWRMTSLTFKELTEFWHGQRPMTEFPRKPVILTFDDGYRDTLTNAMPLLEKYGFRASVFLLADTSVTSNIWDTSREPDEPRSELLSPEERRKLNSDVIEIGAHGLDHLDLTTVNDETALTVMKETRERLAREFGFEPQAYAFTYGRRRDSFSDLTRRAGYEFAVNTDYGGLLLSDDRRSLFRVNVFPGDGYLALWKKTRPWYRMRKI